MDLVNVIQQESYTYRDPITEFLECLYVNFDFDGAQTKLRECETVLLNDFFLVACRDDFIENARLFIFETYCRIHQCIDIEMLAEKLNMTAIEAERWIVNLIRNARLDAKIDSKQNTVVMGTQYPSLYQQVIEKTKGLTFRSHVMSSSLEKRAMDYGHKQHQSQDRDNRRDNDNREKFGVSVAMVIFFCFFYHDHEQILKYPWSNSQDFDHDHCQNPNFTWSTCNLTTKLKSKFLF